MNSTQKTILIVVIILIAFCCLCSLATAGGAAIYFAWPKGPNNAVNTVSPPTDFEQSPLPTDEIATPFPEEDSTETPDAALEPTQESQPDSTQSGMDTSREEMVQFLNVGDAFRFEKPVDMAGFETVMGYHKTLCLKGDCAAVTLLGPAENLVAVSAAVPTDPTSKAQTLTSITLLMTLASHFTGGDANFPTQILNDVLDAQAKQKTMNKKTTVNDFTFTESYDSKTHIAGLVIAK
jgi:hypothetical protein